MLGLASIELDEHGPRGRVAPDARPAREHHRAGTVGDALASPREPRVLRARDCSEARLHERDEQIASLQSTFADDPRKERWIHEAMLAFRHAGPAQDALIDAWVAAEPQSFARDRRGDLTPRATPTEAMEGMREAMTRAVADCERALALGPDLVVARQRLITIARAAGLGDAEAQLALESCPTCFRVRSVAFGYLVPRWGGSLDEMSASAGAAIREHPEAPYLRPLAGMRAEEECEQPSRDPGSLDAALARCDAAVASGEEWSFHHARARVHERRGDRGAAMADLEHALAIDPRERSPST